MPSEIELKLELGDKGADALEASAVLNGTPETLALHATYFDTPAHDLRRNGLSLRVRREGSRWVQTIKADGARSVGVFDRSEWELPVKGGMPVPDGRSPLLDLLDGDIEALAPVFEVVVERKIWQLVEDETTVEVALDRGEVRASGRSLHFGEIELELVTGPARALFALADRVDQCTPARLGVLTKAERGYRLLDRLRLAARAEDVFLNVGMDLPGAIAAIGQSCLRQYRLNENVLLDSQLPEATHQARVALRRMRAALRIFRDVLGRRDAARFNDRLRRLAATLGDARDLDVLTASLPEGPLHERLVAAQPRAHEAVRRTLASRRTRQLVLHFAEWLASGAWRERKTTADMREMPLERFAAEALDRLLRRLRKHGRHLTTVDHEARHRLRKDAKKLRYATEFFGSLFVTRPERKRYGKFVKALQRLQNDLGALNDRANAEMRLAALGLATHEECEANLGAWDETALLESAQKDLHKLLECRPFWR